MPKFVIAHEYRTFHGASRISYWARIPTHGWAYDIGAAKVWKTRRGAEAAFNANRHLMSGKVYVQEIT